MGTHRVQRGYRQGTDRVQTGHTQGTDRVQTGYREGTQYLRHSHIIQGQPKIPVLEVGKSQT